jgi:uncharacterized protein (DUF4415 family)
MKDPIQFDDDNPEWTAADFARARPAHEVLPPEVLKAFPKSRGATSKPPEHQDLQRR